MATRGIKAIEGCLECHNFASPSSLLRHLPTPLHSALYRLWRRALTDHVLFNALLGERVLNTRLDLIPESLRAHIRRNLLIKVRLVGCGPNHLLVMVVVILTA